MKEFLQKALAAWVGKPEQHDSHRFLELVSQNRFVNLRTFTNVEDAREWLLNGKLQLSTIGNF
jgi:hypothetical protein